MPRRARETGEFLHIIVRGNGKQILFEDDSDKVKYLSFIRKFADETEIVILAYCLMENHVHLLLRDSQAKISVFMKKTGVSYAQYYNRKYEHTGHLFQDRYKSELIADDTYLLSVLRYILNNPVKAGICPAEEYPWSSYHEYGKANGLADTSMLYDMIGNEAEFRQFMQWDDETEHLEAEPRKKDDAWALETLQKELNLINGTQLQQFEKKQRDEMLALLKKKGLSVRQIERLTGINRGIIQKA